MLSQKVLDAYTDGSPLGLIIESFNITHEQAIQILQEYTQDSRYKKSFTDDFKMMIAQRDINGGKDITRASIANELGINPNTVKKACEQFGQSLKDKASSVNTYTRMDGDFDIKSCPSCNSKKVNIVEENTTYCKKCGNEHTFVFEEDGTFSHVLKINFEYLEE